MHSSTVHGGLRRHVVRAALCVAFCAIGPFLVASNKTTLIPIDIPGAGTGAGQGTTAFDINIAGTVTGYYVDQANLGHAFLRAPDGRVTTIDVPAAGNLAIPGCSFNSPTGVPVGQGTYASSTNPKGETTGFYVDAVCVAHGYVRSAHGAITTFDAPGAGASRGQGTLALTINPEGVVSGQFLDGGNAWHAFQRAADGAITVVDAPGAGTGPGQGTLNGLPALSPTGAITGFVIDADYVIHAFVREPDGTITPFDAPGAGTGLGQGTMAWSINAAGTVTAYWVDSGNAIHGYMRSARGEYTAIEVPVPNVGTIPESINGPGDIVGNFLDGAGVNHGFLRDTSGKYTLFDAPLAGAGPGQGTIPFTSNPMGTVAGAYFDSNNVVHGFLRTK